MSEPIREFVPETAAPETKPAPEMPAETVPMAWHKFLIRLMLPVAALYHLFQAVWILLGKVYYTAAVRNTVYAGLPAMRILDYALAALMIAAAVLLLCARGKLAKLHEQGARLLSAAYGLLVFIWLAYGLGRYLLAGLSFLSIPVIGQTASYLALLLINHTYYARRKGLLKAKD